MASRINYKANYKINYSNWEDININWDELDITWDEIYSIIEIISKLGGSSWGSLQEKNNPWKRIVETVKPEIVKDFLKILCTTNSISYEKIKEKKTENLKISVKEIEKTLSEKLKIKIKI